MHNKTRNSYQYTSFLLAIALLFAAGQKITFAQSNLPDDAYSMYRISLTQKDMSVMIRTVIGDETQPESILIRGLYSGFVDAWGSAANLAREDLKNIVSTSTGKGADYYRATIQPKIAQEQAAWVVEAKQLENQFLSDVQSILTDKEQARWPRFEQARRRGILLRRYSRLAGEGIDLINIVNTLHFPDEITAVLQPILDDYAGELDAAILERQVVMDKAKERMKAIADKQSHGSKESIYRDILRVHKALRDINERYAALIEQQLPDDLAAIFRQKFDQSRYPRILAPTQADRYIYQVRRLDTLSDDQRGRIEARWSQYEVELEPIIVQLIEIQKKRNEEIPYQYRSNQSGGPSSVTGGSVSSSMATGRVPDSVKTERDIWKKRQSLETKLIDDVFEMLNEEQRAQAPKSSSSKQPGGFPNGPLEGNLHDPQDGG